ncbi:hypothetical protein [Lentibacillus amyloliquefaciens]|uniref:Uncharacterized protein n=1 Tax=Lentibacillus amyloliquefaciens TaxID=1472767 RepID=A0A0U4EAY3_9BACI|nr:hypothetical protein [Lentibacillus amyloliquefaciens]ALX47705.1 hypothetical protein AOX59_03255 [Lentibacillus amyloliquefaciens]
MIRFFLALILGIFLFLIVGSLVLEEFPATQPLWEEFKEQVVQLYNMSLVRYGAVTTIVIIIAIFVVFGSNRKL